MKPSAWTDEQIKTAHRMWRERKSATEIAEKVGRTRNAVLGMIHRSGLSGTREPVVERRVTITKSKISPRSRVRNEAPVRVAKPPRSQPAPRIAAPTERDERRKIADTAFGPETSYLGPSAVLAGQNGKCRWPVGDPASPMFRMCLAVTEREQVYCAAHSALARVLGSAAKIKAYDPMVVTVSRARNDFASVDQVMR